MRPKSKINFTKLNNAGMGSHILLALTAIVSIAGIGAYRVFFSHAATTQYAIGIEAKNGNVTGCWLAGREREDDKQNCKQACRNGAETFVPRNQATGTPGYCKGYIALDVDQATCVDKLHRWYVKQLGCARRADNENIANARQCIGYNSTDIRAYKRYVNGKPDQCVGDRIHIKDSQQDITYPAKPTSEIAYIPSIGLEAYRSLPKVTLNSYLHGPFSSADAANCSANRTSFAAPHLDVTNPGTYKLALTQSPSQNGWYKWSVEDPADTNSQVCGGAFHIKGCNCFSAADNALLNNLHVWQQAPLLSSDAQTKYNYWPATDITTNQTQTITASSWTGGKRWSFLWANRRNEGGQGNTKVNQIPGPTVKLGDTDCRTFYTTPERANAATQSQVRHLVGMSTAEVRQPWLATGGQAADIITYSDLSTHPERYCTGPRQTVQVEGEWLTYIEIPDKVILPPSRLVDGSNANLNEGIVIDYEVQDKRTPAQTTAFINALAADAHHAGKKLAIYTNPLTANTMKSSGLDSTNLPRILDKVDYLGVQLWHNSVEGSVPASYAAQIKQLGTIAPAEWSKLFIIYEIGQGEDGTTLDDARWVYRKLHEDGKTHPTNVMFWRHHAEQGGTCDTDTNKKIATVLFGQPRPAL